MVTVCVGSRLWVYRSLKVALRRYEYEKRRKLRYSECRCGYIWENDKELERFTHAVAPNVGEYLATWKYQGKKAVFAQHDHLERERV